MSVPEEIDSIGLDRVHVLLDALALGPRPAGVARYIDCLLQGLLAQPAFDVTVLTRPDVREVVARRGFKAVSPGALASRPPLRLLWEQLRLPAIARRHGVRLVHGLMGAIPLRCPIPAVVTIHDATFVTHPELHRRDKVAYFRFLLPRTAAAARIVIADSDATRGALIDRLGVAATKIRVVPLSVDPVFVPASAREIEDTRARFDLRDPFVLFTGVLEPRKNLARLIAAILELRRSGLPHRLVLAGKDGWNMAPLRATLHRAGDAVRRLGFVTDAELRALFGACDVFAYVPLAEGFGLPVVEAMACGAPVVTSNLSSLPEAAGGAAELVDPTAVDDIARGIRRVIGDSALRAALVLRGAQRARLATPARMAQATVAHWREALAEHAAVV